MLTRSLPSDAPDMLTREAPIRASSWNAERRTFEVVLSVGSSVSRYDHAGRTMKSSNCAARRRRRCFRC